MSVTAMKHAFACARNLNMTEKAAHVFKALAWHHDQATGRCDPSNKRLQQVTKLSERSVRNAVRELERVGIIRARQRRDSTKNGWKNYSNHYSFSWNRQLERRVYGAVHAGGVGQHLPTKGQNQRSQGRTISEPWDLVIDEDYEDTPSEALSDDDIGSGEPEENVVGQNEAHEPDEQIEADDVPSAGRSV